MALLPVFVLIILFVVTSPCQSESDDTDTLTQAKPLSHGDTLVSRNGVFALGFFSTTTTAANSNESLYYIGIWYNIDTGVRVWVANRDSPVTSSAMLAITNNQELALSDSSTGGTTAGRADVWTTATGGGDGGVAAVLLSSGNFVLRSANGTTIWQSFDHPSATILPTMKVLLSYKGSVKTRISACKSAADMSPGDMYGSIDPSSNLQFFVWKSGRPYYRISFFDDVSVFGFGGAATATATSTSGGVVRPSVVNTGDEVYYTYNVSDGSPLTRVLLKHDGSISLLTRTRNGGNTPAAGWRWTSSLERPGPGSACDLYASCGPFGYCDRTEAVPSCRCLHGFDPIDGLDISRGCRRNEPLECGVEDRFVALALFTSDKYLEFIL